MVHVNISAVGASSELALAKPFQLADIVAVTLGILLPYGLLLHIPQGDYVAAGRYEVVLSG